MYSEKLQVHVGKSHAFILYDLARHRNYFAERQSIYSYSVFYRGICLKFGCGSYRIMSIILRIRGLGGGAVVLRLSEDYN
jgi:hypothetical protein